MELVEVGEQLRNKSWSWRRDLDGPCVTPTPLTEHLPAVAQTDAGRHRRIVDMSDTTVLSFGPAAADVLDALAVAVYAPEVAG